MLPTFFQQKTAATGAAFGAAQPCAGFRSPARVSLFAIAPPRTHKIAIEEFCQIGRLEIKFGRLEIIHVLMCCLYLRLSTWGSLFCW